MAFLFSGARPALHCRGEFSTAMPADARISVSEFKTTHGIHLAAGSPANRSIDGPSEPHLGKEV